MKSPDSDVHMSGQPNSYGIARRLRNNADGVPNSVVMAIVVCDDCGARFAVTHRGPFQNSPLAARQAVWLKDRFVWDHIQETRHCGSIRLPASHEMKPEPLATFPPATPFNGS
jgi:hypothetical protein